MANLSLYKKKVKGVLELDVCQVVVLDGKSKIEVTCVHTIYNAMAMF